MSQPFTNDDVVFVGAARTPIGRFSGSLSSLTPAELGTIAAKAAIERAQVDPSTIDHAVFGHIIPTGPADAYLARNVALNCGLKDSSAAFNVNRLCGSSVQSIISAAQLIKLGDSHMVLAGGAESMSQGGYLLPKVRDGLRMGHAPVLDLTLGTLSDPFDSGHMGVTAENIAEQYGLTREQLDAFAVQSQQRAAKAQAEGVFSEQIVPVAVEQGRKTIALDHDEHVRGDTTLESLASLKPVFKKGGVVTAGNASGLNDGAAAVVMTNAKTAAEQQLKVLGRVVSYAFAGVAPNVMGLGPIPAVKEALAKANLTIADLDLIESNEAFAAQALAVAKDLGLANEKTNPNGGAIAMGHPVGATGAILTVKVLYELERINGRYGMVTMCIGGGQGIALIIERPQA